MKLNYDLEYLNGGSGQEFHMHGEDWFLKQLSKTNPKVIFDVGSNIGEWTKLARSYCPTTEIHCFEVINSTFHKLYHNLKYDSNLYLNNYGLSNVEEIINFKFIEHNDRISTGLPLLRFDDSRPVTGYLKTGDSYVEEYQIDHIDLLKIDAEGMGNRVLKGLMKTLEQGKIGAIQFEYDRACILERFILIDHYEMLCPLGFKLGRLRQGNVEFKDYSLYDENFNGPEYIACHVNNHVLLHTLNVI